MKLERSFSWTELLPTAEEAVSGTFADFLFALAIRQPKRRLPPFPVLKDILSRGIHGGGMGGGLRWDTRSVALDSATYSELPSRLVGLRVESDSPAQRLEEWLAWCAQRDGGIDYMQHLALLDRLRAAEQARERGQDMAEDNYAAALTDYLEFISAQTQG